jgi:hypothetical protein
MGFGKSDLRKWGIARLAHGLLDVDLWTSFVPSHRQAGVINVSFVNYDPDARTRLPTHSLASLYHVVVVLRLTASLLVAMRHSTRSSPCASCILAATRAAHSSVPASLQQAQAAATCLLSSP